MKKHTVNDVLKMAKNCGDVGKTCKYFGISRVTYYTFLRKKAAGIIDGKMPLPTLRINLTIKQKIRAYNFVEKYGYKKAASKLKLPVKYLYNMVYRDKKFQG